MLLSEELIAWERNQLHSIRHVFIVYVYEFNIALVRECSLRSNVDNYCQFETFDQVTDEHFFALYTCDRYSFNVGFVNLTNYGVESTVLK